MKRSVRPVARWAPWAVMMGCGVVGWLAAPRTAMADPPAVFSGTEPLTWEGDLASRLVEQADQFLLRRLEESVARRPKFWQRDTSSPEAYASSVEPNRERLRHIVGLRDPRPEQPTLELIATLDRPAKLAQGPGFQVLRVRWAAFGDVVGEGLLLEPREEPVAQIVAIPDADQVPEDLVGIRSGLPPEAQFARHLAEMGCRVVIPVLLDRHLERRRGRANLTNREYIYRSAFELGRHVIGYELQQVLAVVDWFQQQEPQVPVGLVGWGEGGLLALYGGAVDTRVAGVCVSGYFDSRQGVWQEPIDRNVFGLLEQFGDAEIASLIAPRLLTVEQARGPERELPSEGGAPGRLRTPPLEAVRQEVQRARQFTEGLSRNWLSLVEADDQPPLCPPTLIPFLSQLTGLPATPPAASELMLESAPPADAELAARQSRMLYQLDRHNQQLLAESPYVRAEFMKELETDSMEQYRGSVERYRRIFREDVIGAFEEPLVSPRPRTRKVYDQDKWTGYEVVLDVYQDLFAYGVLLWPKGIAEGEKRPVVVCQHGLEGRPQDTIAGDHPAYHDFAARLAEQGYIVFAPQNLYIFQDRFRTLQRKANPLKKTLFSLIVPQHRQITDWLTSLPEVDPERIAFYGLSYGGKSAMRIPALVDRYCLSICSADFNDWVWKNASTRSPYSYVWTGEYEIFEFDLGSTFNYSEMAALIAPRPFMVERGHFDGVAPDERVAYEFAKVRNLYQARLGIGERCELEWFVGPHTIHGVGTFAFLRKHLDFKAAGSEPGGE